MTKRERENKGKKLLEQPIRCLAFLDEEDSDSDKSTRWCAVAVDMDVWAHGPSEKKAKESLTELIKMQVEFALEEGQLHLLYHPTEKQYIELYELSDYRDKLQEFCDKLREAMDRMKEFIPAPERKSVLDNLGFDKNLLRGIDLSALGARKASPYHHENDKVAA